MVEHLLPKQNPTPRAAGVASSTLVSRSNYHTTALRCCGEPPPLRLGTCLETSRTPLRAR